MASTAAMDSQVRPHDRWHPALAAAGLRAGPDEEPDGDITRDPDDDTTLIRFPKREGDDDADEDAAVEDPGAGAGDDSGEGSEPEPSEEDT